MTQMELPFPEKIPFSIKEDGSLESEWFVVEYKDGRKYRAQIRIQSVEEDTVQAELPSVELRDSVLPDL